LFQAGAEFCGRGPWIVLAEWDVLEATTASGDVWLVSVRGNGGSGYGLELYAREADIAKALSATALGRTKNLAEGPLLSLLVEGRAGSRGRRRRGKAAGPELMALNLPGGGVTERQIDDLAALLRAIPEYASAHADEIEEGTLVTEPFRAAGVAIRSWRYAAPYAIEE
jgi:hypothetical protein